MNASDEYRRNAEECRELANHTKQPGEMAAWLKLADHWLSLAQSVTVVHR